MAEQVSDAVASATFNVLKRAAKEAGAIGVKVPKSLIKSTEAKFQEYQRAKAAKLSKAETAKKYDAFLEELGKLEQVMIDKGAIEPEQLEDPIKTMIHQDFANPNARTDSEGDIVVNERLDNAKENIEKMKDEKGIGDEARAGYPGLDDDPNISDEAKEGLKKKADEMNKALKDDKSEDAEQKYDDLINDLDKQDRSARRIQGAADKKLEGYGIDNAEGRDAWSAADGITNKAKDTLRPALDSPDKDVRTEGKRQLANAKGMTVYQHERQAHEAAAGASGISRGNLTLETLKAKLHNFNAQNKLDSLAMQAHIQKQIQRDCEDKIRELKEERDKHIARQTRLAGVKQAFTGKDQSKGIDDNKAWNATASRYERKIAALIKVAENAEIQYDSINKEYKEYQKEYVQGLTSLQNDRIEKGMEDKAIAARYGNSAPFAMKADKAIDKYIKRADANIDQRYDDIGKAGSGYRGYNYINKLDAAASTKLGRLADTHDAMKHNKNMSHAQAKQIMNKYDHR